MTLPCKSPQCFSLSCDNSELTTTNARLKHPVSINTYIPKLGMKYILTTVFQKKKRHPFYFLNNSVRRALIYNTIWLETPCGNVLRFFKIFVHLSRKRTEYSALRTKLLQDTNRKPYVTYGIIVCLVTLTNL